MNRQQAAGAMATLATAYRQTIDEEQMALWYRSVLEPCAVEAARLVVERIVSEDEWFPTPARFNEVRRAVERGLEPSVQALPPAPPTDAAKNAVRAHIAAARQAIVDAKPLATLHGRQEAG